MKKFLFGFVLLVCVQFSIAQHTDTIFVQLDDVNLHTVLSSPKEKAEALAIFIVGSGPTDLNGNQAMMKNNSLKYLSDELLKNKISTVRFDKRGAGESIVDNYSEEKLAIGMFAKDVEELIQYFKKKTKQNIYLIGHSQGSLVGLIAAQNIPVDGFISISGAGNSIDVILKKQLQPKLPPSYYTQAVGIIDSLKNGNHVKTIPPHLQSVFRPSVQPYMISWMKYQPAELIKSLKCKSLVVQGNKDIQVDLEEAQVLSQATENAELLVIEKMNHVLKTIEGGVQGNITSYTNPKLPVNKELVKGIVRFIKQN